MMQNNSETSDNELFEKIYPKVLDFVAYQPRTIKEVLDKIYKLGIKWKLSSETTSMLQIRIITELKQVHLLDDRDYAQTYISQKLSGKPVSSQKLKTFLFKKGVAAEIINETLQGLSSEFEFDAAFAEAEKKLKIFQTAKNVKRFAPFQLRQKIYAYLAGKGYPSDICSRVVDSLPSLK